MSIVESMLENRKEKLKAKEEHEKFDFDKFYTDCMNSGLLTPLHEKINRTILNKLNEKYENLSDYEFSEYASSYQIHDFDIRICDEDIGKLFGAYLKKFPISDGTEYTYFGGILYRCIIRFLTFHKEIMMYNEKKFYPYKNGTYILEFDYLLIKGKW